MYGFELFQEVPCSGIVQVLKELDLPLDQIVVESGGGDSNDLRVWIANESIDWKRSRESGKLVLHGRNPKRLSLPRMATSPKSTASKSRTRGISPEESA